MSCTIYGTPEFGVWRDFGPKKEKEGARVMMMRVVGRLCVLSADCWVLTFTSRLSYCPDVFAHVAVHACTGRGRPDDERVVFIT